MALPNSIPTILYDEVIVDITDYVYHYEITSGRAWKIPAPRYWMQ
jgi:hypothetical protein